MVKLCIKTSSVSLSQSMLSLLLMKMTQWEKLSKSILNSEHAQWDQHFSVGLLPSQSLLRFMPRNSVLKEQKWCKNFGETTTMIKKPKNGKITANQTMIKILKEPLFPSLWSPLSDFAELQWMVKWIKLTKWWEPLKFLLKLMREISKENISWKLFSKSGSMPLMLC